MGDEIKLTEAMQDDLVVLIVDYLDVVKELSILLDKLGLPHANVQMSVVEDGLIDLLVFGSNCILELINLQHAHCLYTAPLCTYHRIVHLPFTLIHLYFSMPYGFFLT